MLVKDAMSTHIEWIAPDATLQECARKMRRTDVGALAVEENGSLVGIVTDRDICCRAVGDDHDPATMKAREVMTANVASCFEDQDCDEAARFMKQNHLRRLAVKNRKQKLVGLLTVDDLARYSHRLAGEVLEAAAPWPH